MNGQFSKKFALVAALGLLALAPMQASAANKLIVNGTDGTTPKFVVNDSGFVGVGNSVPGTPIDIVGTNTLGSQIRTRMQADNNNGGGGYIGYLNRATGSTLPLNGNRLGYFLFGSLSPILTGGNPTPLNSIGLNFLAEGDWTFDGVTTFMPGGIAFATTESSTRTEKVRITGSGNVGIGITTPGQKLEVIGGVKLNSGAQPACNAAARGTLWYTQGGTGVADTLAVCVKDASDVFGWKTL